MLGRRSGAASHDGSYCCCIDSGDLVLRVVSFPRLSDRRSRIMFTGIVTAIGTIVARNGGVSPCARPMRADGIAIGASIAHDGCCLTVTAVERERGRCGLHAGCLQRDAVEDHARQLEGGDAGESRACAQGRRRTRRPHGDGAHRRGCEDHRRSGPTATAAASRSRCRRRWRHSSPARARWHSTAPR